MGGGGFSTEGERSPLDERAPARWPARAAASTARGSASSRTASGDSPDYLGRFHMAFDAVAEASHLTLFDREVEDIPPFLPAQDAHLRRRRQHAQPARGLAGPRRRRRAARRHDAGVVLGGLSAGSICWFESGHDRLVRPDAAAARRRARAHRRQPLAALRRRAPATPDVPRARRRRPAAGRAGRRRRRGRAVRRPDARRGRRLATPARPPTASSPTAGAAPSRPRWRPGSCHDRGRSRSSSSIPSPSRRDGPLTRLVGAARRAQAERHRVAFTGRRRDRRRASSAGRPTTASRSARGCAALVPTLGDGGLVVLGSGAVPLATRRATPRRFVATARGRRDRPGALANNRYSADVVAIADARDGPGRTCPTWPPTTACRAGSTTRGVPVEDRRGRWRLGVDIDGPLDLVLLGGRWARHLPGRRARPSSRDRLARDPGGRRRPGRRAARRRSDVAAASCAGSSGRRRPGPGRSSRSAGCAPRRRASDPPRQRPRVAPRRPTGRAPLGDVPGRPRRRGAHRQPRPAGPPARRGRRARWPSTEDRFASDLLLAERHRRSVAARR